MNFEYEGLMWSGLAFSFMLAIFLIVNWKTKQLLIKRFVANSNLKIGVSHWLQKTKITLLFLAFIMAFLALARPQWGRSEQEFIEKGVDIMLVVDTSKSLLAEDLKPNRFERIRLAVQDLISRGSGNRFGLVVFAGNAFVQTPLTSDPGALNRTVNALDVGMIKAGGSDITLALDQAAKAFESDNQRYRAIVLFSDGEDHSQDTASMARALAKQNIKVFTVGAATLEGELIPIPLQNGSRDYHKDRDGNVVKSRLNEESLKSISETTSGFYVNLQDIQAMERIYQQGILAMPKSDLSVRKFNQLNEQFQWPLAIAVILLVLEFLIPQHSNRKSGNMDSANAILDSRSPQANLLITFFLIILASSPTPIFAQDPTSASIKSAQKALRNNNLENARSQFSHLVQKYPNDPRIKFNLGTTEYKLGNLEEAESHFKPLLRQDDLELQQKAYYALGNTRFLQGKNTQDPQNQMNLWSQSLDMLTAATKLNPNDSNAQSNKNFVHQQLEQLKEQQQNQDQNQDQEQNDQDQEQNDQEQDNESENQNQDQDQNDNQNPDSQDEENQDNQDSEENQDDNRENENGNENRDEEQEDQSNEQQQDQSGQGEQNENENQGQSPAPAELTRQQIENFLKSVDQKGRFLMFSPTNNVRNRQGFSQKDW